MTAPHYPSDYLACTTCRVRREERCRSRSGVVVGGRPDGVPIELDAPHVLRKVRAGA